MIKSNHNNNEPVTSTELAKVLQSIDEVSNIEPYDLVNNYGCYFIKNGEKHDMRRWLNCYGVDAGWSVTHCKGNSYQECIDYIKA